MTDRSDIWASEIHGLRADLARALAEGDEARADLDRDHDHTGRLLTAMRDDLARLEAHNAALREALTDVMQEAACTCHAAYTDRGRHEPNALCYLADIARGALASPPPVSPYRERVRREACAALADEIEADRLRALILEHNLTHVCRPRGQKSKA